MEQATTEAVYQQPITLEIRIEARQGREREFEQYLRSVNQAAANFPGFLGARVIRPPRGSREYRVVMRFDKKVNLQQWLQSEEKKGWHARGEGLAENSPRIENITGTAQEQPLALALAPVSEFVRTSISGIGLLLIGAVLALILANSPWAAAYEHFWETEFTIGTASFGITESLRHWINDALMALFFFTVGLEIKREVLVGELRRPRQAALPIAAAIGGALTPALIYLVLNAGDGTMSGWGIPIGTDTAFSLGILSLLAARVPPLLVVFVTAFAIVDDIIAVMVIAVFYTNQIAWPSLGLAAILIGALVVANLAGFHRWPIYAFLGLGVWLAVFHSGIHGTIAGVLVAMTVPSRSWINPKAFVTRARELLDEFEAACDSTMRILSNERQQRATQELEELAEDVETPLTHLQHRLNPWVVYAVLPLFAFANAGIPLVDGLGDAVRSPVTWGVIAGLVLGKPLGISLFSWLAVRTGVALLPSDISLRDVLSVATLGGIGFTMSLFISELAFGPEISADDARIGILIGSVVIGALGYRILRTTLPPPESAPELSDGD
ncbi:Na+/H+ antiporter NhaA [Sphaerobacter sp.]|uniref:Na+/H+ antiporter NhaA n=1 Tax=Sphaerobacter sp. TaxID=2099654 RepID=UPI0025F22003|nr:Na+/H+ antiporter NhaA [Sphaerobacter sp.]